MSSLSASSVFSCKIEQELTEATESEGTGVGSLSSKSKGFCEFSAWATGPFARTCGKLSVAGCQHPSPQAEIAGVRNWALGIIHWALGIAPLAPMPSSHLPVPNSKFQTNSNTLNSKPGPRGSSTVLGEERRRSSRAIMGNIMAQPRPFLSQGMGPSRTGCFDGFEFGICLGFGIWNLSGIWDQ